MTHRALAPFALIFSLTLASSPAFAKLEFTAALGIGESYASGSWTPLRVLVKNSPDPQHPDRLRDYRGQIRATVTANDYKAVRYTQDIDLPGHSQKLVEFSIILPNNSSAVVVDMIDARGRELGRLEVPRGNAAAVDQRAKVRTIPTVILERDPNENIGLPNWISRSINIQRLELGELPSDIKGYSEVSVVVIRGRLSNQMTKEQLGALENWIQFGGELLVVTSAAQDELKLDTWLAPKLPGTMETVKQVKLSEIMSGSPDDPILLTTWQDFKPDADRLWNSSAGTIAVSQHLGTGRITALGIDPSAIGGSSLSSPVGRELQRMIESIILSPRPEDLRARHIWSTSSVDPDFSNSRMLPNIFVVASLLIVFVVVVGPLNFYILRKRRRLELAWITIPVLSLMFFIAVYVYGVMSKGSAQYYASAEILHLPAGKSQGLLLWTSSQFSPTARDYRLTTADGGAILPLGQYYDIPRATNFPFAGPIGAPLSGLTGEAGDPATALLSKDRGYDLINPVGQWTMAFYQGEKPLEIKGTIDGKVTMKPQGEGRIQISNNTNSALTEAEVYVGSRRYALGDIAPQSKFEKLFSEMNADAIIFRMPSGAPGYQQYRGRPPGPRPGVPATPTAVPTPISAGVDKFQFTASRDIRAGAFNNYPLFEQQHPQRRCRLIARQTDWTSQVQVDPKPDDTKTASLVEVELPLELDGTVTLQSKPAYLNKNSNAGPLRLEVYDGEQHAGFFDNLDDFCALNDSWAEALIAPPSLAGPVKFAGGEVVITYSGSPLFLLVRAFNYATGAWETAIEETEIEGDYSRHPVSMPIRSTWVNPYGNTMRIHVESRPPTVKKMASGAGANNPNAQGISPFNRMGVVTIHSLEASMAFTGSAPAPVADNSAPIAAARVQ